MRIPAVVLEAARVRVDEAVDVREEGGRIVIKRIEATAFDLDAMLAGITEENRHEPEALGGQAGREVW